MSAITVGPSNPDGTPVTDEQLLAIQGLLGISGKADALAPDAAITGSSDLDHTQANRQVPVTGAGGYVLTLTDDATSGCINDDAFELINRTPGVIRFGTDGATLVVPPGYRTYALPGENLQGTRIGADRYTSTTIDSTGVASTEITDDYTLTLADVGGCLDLNAATDKDITFPPDSDVDIPINARGEIAAMGVGLPTAVAGAGVTLVKSSARSFTTSAQGESMFWRKTAADTFFITAN